MNWSPRTTATTLHHRFPNCCKVVTHRIEDGKLAEKWSNKDELGFLQQLGVILTPEEAYAS